MSKYTEIFNYLRQCPQLRNLWSLVAEQNAGDSVIWPQGTSQRTQLKESIDVTGHYDYDIKPLPSLFEDYQINCYKSYTANDGEPGTSYNVLQLEEVQSICDWIIEQNDSGNLPALTGKHVISIEPLPFNPQIRGIDPTTNTIAYYITVRIRYINPAIENENS